MSLATSEPETDIDVREMLALQLSEVEMLASMYPGSGEFVLDDPACVSDIQVCLDEMDARIGDLRSRIGFTMHLQLDNEAKHTIEMVCRFPHEYPTTSPEVFLRTPLPKADHRKLSDDLHVHIQNHEPGELIVSSIIEWLKDNSLDYYLKLNDKDVNINTTASQAKLDTTFTRMWLYSHHIYSKIKRKDILEFAPELKLTGFCMPGKPGMIVIEGYSSDVEEFWYRIRRMQWKQITMKEKEDFEIEGNSVDHFRKFKNFEEKHFDPRQGKGRNAHMDLGELIHSWKNTAVRQYSTYILVLKVKTSTTTKTF